MDCDSLTTVRAEGVREIRAKAFSNCESLTTIYLGSGFKKIEHGAFNDCKSLKTIYFNGTEAQWNNVTKYTDDTLLYNPWDKDTGDYEVIFLK